MSIFLPKIYSESIYTINYDKLLDIGVKVLLFDLDNTLVKIDDKKPSKEVIDHFNYLKQKGFTILIFSNSPNIRIKPFKKILGVDVYAFALKPYRKNFDNVINRFNLKPNEVAIIGDQLLTDIQGGNKSGIITILVNPISNKDSFFTVFNRIVERKIYKKLKDNYNFEKGKYYE